jgi:hypothetical protein
MSCPLKLDKDDGLIFSSSVTPIVGTVNMELKNKLGPYEILILDRHSKEIRRISLKSDKPDTSLETLFTWDLKSKSDSYVESGCYTISLVDASNSLKETKYGSIKCKVADTRNILSITRSLKSSLASPSNDPQMLSSIYFDIIGDIEIEILERLKNNRFEEPYFVTCITACFIQGIADDIQNQSKSQFLRLIAECQSRYSISEQQIRTARLGLWMLFDFLINYMSDMEDHVRANAMAKCGQCQLTENDKAQIVSSLVMAIYPHCKTISFSKNAIGSTFEKIIQYMIKFGIKYVSAKHVKKSISICQALPPEDPCDVVI